MFAGAKAGIATLVPRGRPIPSTDDKSANPNEQRDHLANVRTLLAWVRTAITIMAFGFVVAKFGIILDELPGHRHSLGLHEAAIIGTALVVAGAVFLILSTLEFLAVRRAIDEGEVHFRPGIYFVLSGGLVAVAMILAAYLLATG
jgi:putative membrane protein